MSWLLTQLGNLGSLVFGAFLKIFGFIAGALSQAILVHLILPLLKATVFQPFSLAPHTLVGTVAAEVWGTLAAASAGVALVVLLWGVLTHMAGAIGGRQSLAELSEGLLVWLAVMVAGWAFLNVLLNISNLATGALVTGLAASAKTAFAVNTGLGVASGMAGITVAVFTDLLWPVSGLVILALALWTVGVWLMRQVDLVLYAGLLPLTAALGISGNKTPFKWAWSEAMGAVFNQLAMAFIMWLGFQFVAKVHTVPLAYGAPNLHGILSQFLAIGLTVTTLTMTARAPQMLGNITGHRSAGAGHLLTGMALGYLGGRGAATMLSGTRLGQGIKQSMEGRAARASAAVSDWGARLSLGQRVGQSTIGQSLQERLQAAGAAVGGAVSRSPVGQAAQRWAAQHPESAAAMARHAATVGGAAQHLARGATQPLRTAASLAYQPRATLGALAAQGMADSHPEGPAGLIAQSQAATVYTAQHGVEAAAQHFFGSNAPPPPGVSAEEMRAAQVAQLGHLINARITPPDPAAGQDAYQVQFFPGAPQAALFTKTQQSGLRNIPSAPVQRPVYSMSGLASTPPAAARSASS